MAIEGRTIENLVEEVWQGVAQCTIELQALKVEFIGFKAHVKDIPTE